MSDAPKRSSIGFRATVILLLPVLYVLGSGPVLWLSAHDAIPEWAGRSLEWIYLPLFELAETDGPFHEPLDRYLRLWVDLD